MTTAIIPPMTAGPGNAGSVQLNQTTAPYVHEADDYLRWPLPALSPQHASAFRHRPAGGPEEDRGETGETDHQDSTHARAPTASTPAFTMRFTGPPAQQVFLTTQP